MPQLADLSIEELANIEVTSVSKKPERAAGRAGLGVRDHGRRHPPLRRRHACRKRCAWRPTCRWRRPATPATRSRARGMNGSVSSAPNKLLVLIDGRSVYTPLFSGVFWDAQDVLLEDVERIEVISGPGGTLWGVNAVNGVINITTRSAHATGGALAVLRGASNGARRRACARAATAASVSWRVYAKTLGPRAQPSWPRGAPVDDAWRQRPGRLSRRLGARRATAFSVNGNAYRGRAEQPEPGAIHVAGSDLQLGADPHRGRQPDRALAAHARRTAAAWRCRPTSTTRRREVPPTFTESLDIVDLQFQHSLPALRRAQPGVGRRTTATAGTGVDEQRLHRLPAGAATRRPGPACSPRTRSRCAHDLRLTLGARLERNPYTGTEWLPTARLAWKAAPAHSAVGRRLAHGARAVAAGRRRLHPGQAAVPAGRRAAVRSEVAHGVRARLPRPADGAGCRIR